MNNKAHPTPTLTAYSLLSLLWSRPAWSGHLPLSPPSMYKPLPSILQLPSPHPPTPCSSFFFAQPQGRGGGIGGRKGRGRKGQRAERKAYTEIQMMVRRSWTCFIWRMLLSWKNVVPVLCSWTLWYRGRIQVQTNVRTPRFYTLLLWTWTDEL